MKLHNAIKKLNKFGFDVHQEGSIYFAISDNYKKKISFMTSPHFDGSRIVDCIRVTNNRNVDKPLEDYFDSFLVDNITQAIQQAEPLQLETIDDC